MRNYELSFMFFLLIKQTNYFCFSKHDLVREYRILERKIAAKSKNMWNVLGSMALRPAKKGNSLAELLDQEEVDLVALEKDHENQLLGTYANTRLKGKPVYKCPEPDFDLAELATGEVESEFLRVPIGVLRAKRSIQEQVVEDMILELFSKKSIFSLLDILFVDMYEDSQIFEEALK